MTNNTPTKAPDIPLYRVFYLVETAEQDYELMLYTDKEQSFTKADCELLNQRLEEIPELKNELNELNDNWEHETSFNYWEEFEDTKEEYINCYSQEYSIDEKEYYD